MRKGGADGFIGDDVEWFRLRDKARHPGSFLICFSGSLVFVPLTDNLAMDCSVLPWTQANVESETSDWGLENVQIFQSPVNE